ncbi:MAG: ARMT1-like domain-containing protein [Spirochaetales bacterium]|nr:ARMT1-like domain-containing protein [Spirochaetales bacterium]
MERSDYWKKDKFDEFSAKDAGSFAKFTIENRFPKIFKEVCSEEYESFIKDHKVDDEKILHSNIPGVDELKKSISSYKDYTIKDFFEKAPFFLVEFYFYHLLLSLRNYDNLKFDFFAAKKDADWKDRAEDFSSKLSVLFDDFEKFNKRKFSKKEKQEFNERKNEHIKSILYYSLTSNTGDLSQLHEIRSESVKCLCNETEICQNYLDVTKPYSRFDIICDNSGAELFSDIYLAVFFLVYGLAKKVVFHLKPCPFFVSDATIDDFSKLVAALTKNGKNTELLDFISKKKIEVFSPNDFWVEPYYFDKMPNGLKNHFDKSNLVIIKGDLNYRRLVGDFNKYANETKSSINFETLEERCLFKNKSNKNIPLVAPRVLKSDVFVGIDSVFEAIGRNSDSQFKTDGKWGVIQTTLPRKTAGRTKKKEKSVSDKNVEKKDNNSDSSKDKKSKHSISEVCFFILFVLVALLLIGSLGAILLIVFSKPLVENWNCKFLENIANFSPKETAERIDFSIILTSLSFLVGGSIFVPKFLLKKEVDESVQKKFKDDIDEILENKTTEFIASKFSSVSNSLNKCDAHLSRMIAFNLKEEFPVWSIGWSIRSLKRYEKLDPNSVGFVEYFDFVDFLRKTVIEGSVQKFFALVKNVKNEINPVIAALEKEAEESGNDSKRLAIRTVKDIVDFEYSVQFKNKNLKNNEILLPICKVIGGLAKCLCSAVMANSQNEKLSEQNLLYRELLEQILQISDYGKKCKDFDAKKDYENRLILVLKELEDCVKSKNENYIKDFAKCDVLFFRSK